MAKRRPMRNVNPVVAAATYTVALSNARAITTPEQTNIQPITYGDAFREFVLNGRHPFSFVVTPYNVLKTITVANGNVIASPPDAARAHYEWVATNNFKR